jgi:hypothetical protein
MHLGKPQFWRGEAVELEIPYVQNSAEVGPETPRSLVKPWMMIMREKQVRIECIDVGLQLLWFRAHDRVVFRLYR